MPFPRVFISSTYVDLADARSSIEECLQSLYFEPIAFERGGISYDHRKPLDLSCYEAVKECDMMILVIGGRYGSKASNLSDSVDGRTINSITKSEYLEAIAAGIKVITFVKENVLHEYYTYRNQPKIQRRTFKPAAVDNIAVFQLIYEVLQLDHNNQVVKYETVSEIVQKLRQEVALLAYKALNDDKDVDSSSDVLINAYKLFYHRRQKGFSINMLATRTRLKRNLITSLEKVKPTTLEDSPSYLPFRTCKAEVLRKIEEALDCKGCLSTGLEDDILSQYVNYYHCNRGKNPTKERPDYFTADLFPKKAVVFDFDGTLTTKKSLTTWEMIWKELGYSINECNIHHRQFSNGLITHEKWCQVTCQKFAERSLSEAILSKVANSIQLVDGVRELVNILEQNDIEMHILSGSIDQIIRLVLGEDLYKRFTNVQANSFKFRNERLVHIEGTKFDFQGKGTYINNLMRSRSYTQMDVLFVGNSSNDKWASRSGVTTLCVNPHFTDGNDAKEWIHCIREMDNIMEILKFIPLPIK